MHAFTLVYTYSLIFFLFTAPFLTYSSCCFVSEMSRLPRGFGRHPSTDSDAPPSKQVPPTTVPTVHPPKDKSPKKRSAASLAPTTSKKPRSLSETSSAVAANFEKHALLHIEKKELDAWKARSKEQAREAVRRATTELFFHNVVDESMRNEDVARSHTLELERTRLLKELKESKKALDSLSNAKNILEESLKIHAQEEARLKGELLDKDATILECKQENSFLSSEITLLKDDQANRWVSEAEKIKAASYEEGFKGYVLGFLATDPEYSWEKFDPDTRKWIQDFKSENESAIAAKKLEIEAELARPNADAIVVDAIPIQQVGARLEEDLGTEKSPLARPEDAPRD